MAKKSEKAKKENSKNKTTGKGIVLSGGSALLRSLDELVAQATGVPTYVADEPLLCVAKGTGIALDNLESYKRSILATK